MPNIKITAEVDGKIVPLNTISTESFEAIKALEKPKEIPVARLVKFVDSSPRLIFKPSENVVLLSGVVHALELKKGTLRATWLPGEDNQWMRKYRNVQPL